MPTPEVAREHIDQALEQAGWRVQDYKSANLHAGKGVVLRNFPLVSGHGILNLQRSSEAVVVDHRFLDKEERERWTSMILFNLRFRSDDVRKNTLEELRNNLRQFAIERDWDQFHSPKNLSMALVAEVAELVEHFQWLTEEQSRNLTPEKLAEVELEIADIQIYLVIGRQIER